MPEMDNGMKVESAGLLLSQTELTFLTSLIGMQVTGEEGLTQETAKAAGHSLSVAGLVNQTDLGYQIEEHLHKMLQRMADSQRLRALGAGERMILIYEGSPIIMMSTQGSTQVSLVPLKDTAAACLYLMETLRDSEAATFVWGDVSDEPFYGDKAQVMRRVIQDIQPDLFDVARSERPSWIA